MMVNDMQKILIGERKVGSGYPPFILAEMSGNHNQSLDRALSIVDAAARAGVHGLKLQTYTAETMTLDMDHEGFVIDDPTSLWYGESLYNLYLRAFTPWEWHEPLIERCREHGMVCFSTPFDVTAVDFLEKLAVPAYKIASFENIDLPLIRRVAATGKPMIISTGMATLAELDEALAAARDAGAVDIVFMKCTSSYPASPKESNLNTIPHMRDLFDLQVGLSDHTKGIGVALASIAFGATIIEKHFTLSRSDGGVDADFSLEPEEMAQLVIESERIWESLGKISYGPTTNEVNSLKFRRSIYVVGDIKAGESFTADNLKVIRPGFGLPPKYYSLLLGKRAAKDIEKGTPIKWDLLLDL